VDSALGLVSRRRTMPLLALGCSGCHLPSGGNATKRCCASTTRAGLATSYDVGSGTAGAGFSFSWNHTVIVFKMGKHLPSTLSVFL